MMRDCFGRMRGCLGTTASKTATGAQTNAVAGSLQQRAASSEQSSQWRLRSIKELHAGLADWIAFYNEERPHQAHGYRTPMAVWRAGATAKAVDMVDNAEEALPTCPQPQQQTQTEALAA